MPDTVHQYADVAVDAACKVCQQPAVLVYGRDGAPKEAYHPAGTPACPALIPLDCECRAEHYSSQLDVESVEVLPFVGIVAAALVDGYEAGEDDGPNQHDLRAAQAVTVALTDDVLLDELTRRGVLKSSWRVKGPDPARHGAEPPVGAMQRMYLTEWKDTGFWTPSN